MKVAQSFVGSRYFSSSCALAAAVSLAIAGCSKPKEPAPEIKEPTPAPAAEATPAATPAPAPVETAPAAAAQFETVFFGFDSSTLDASAQEVLRKDAAFLKANAGSKYQLEGHCDERGSPEYNLALGERRANTAKEFLVSEGVTAAQISIISYGEERPASQGTGEEAWSKNRRVEGKKL